MRFCLFILLPYLCLNVSSAQESWEVKNLLLKLEEVSGYRFSYQEEIISGKTVQISSEQLQRVDELIDWLSGTLKVKFEVVDKGYVIIRAFENGDVVDICGSVVDEDGEPVPGVLVSGDTDSLQTVTDKNGVFKLEGVPFDISLTLRHISFNTRKSKALELMGIRCPQLILFESVGFLETLTIRDYLTVGITKERNQIKIFPAEIKILPGHTEPDIMQSIQLAPGINSPYETASGIHVRGGSPDQNLVMWNGIKTYNQGHFFGMLSAFNPYIIDEVSFIKSGTNARYGDRVSSVIDIRSSPEIPESTKGGFGFNLLHADAYIHQPILKDKLSIQIAGRRSFNDLINTITYDKYAERVFQNTKINERDQNQQAQNRFFFHDFSTNINSKIGKNYSMRFSSLYDNNSLDFTTENDSSGTQYNDQLFTKNEGYNLNFSKSGNDKINFDFDIYYSKYLLKYAFNTLENDTLDIATKKNVVKDYGAMLNTSFMISENQKVNAGYEYSHKNIRYAFENETPNYSLVLDVADNRLQNHAVFTEYTLDYGFNSYLQLGSRLNYYQEINDLFLEPRFYLEQSVLKNFALTASAEYRTQGVSQIRESVLSDLSLENKVWTLTSLDGFPVTTSYQLSSGAIYDHNGFYLEGEAYFKRLEGITTLTFGFLNPLGNDFLIGASSIRGFDMFLKKQFTGYKTWLSYAYIFSQNEFTGLNNDEPFPGNWNIEHTVKWSHFFTIDKVQLSMGWLWHTGKAYTEVYEEMQDQGPVIIAYEGLNTQNLPVYHRLDISLVYELNPNNSPLNYRVGVSVLNAYNRKNQLNREFRTTPSLQNSLIETNVYGLGITPNIVLRAFW